MSIYTNLREINPAKSNWCIKLRLIRLYDKPSYGNKNEAYNLECVFHDNENIRSYNNMFCFTSMGGKVDRSLNNGRSPPIFRLHGQNYHLMGSLLPNEGSVPKFAQLYIYDTDNEVENRVHSVRESQTLNSLRTSIVYDLKMMLDENNVLVKSFRMVREKIEKDGCLDVKLKLIGRRNGDGRRYNLPMASEIAGLIVGDFDASLGDRDILVETKTGMLKRINQLHASYLGLQYPILFPYGEDGYREDIPLTLNGGMKQGGRKYVSLTEYFSYRLYERSSELSIILSSMRLLQQFIVDAYTMVESSRLTYIKVHQKHLRCELYSGLTDAILRGETDPSTQGKRVILPSSFTGGARYMIQNYQDAMAICRWVGYPDLFITFTCNPKWPEIVPFVEKRSLKADDSPDIICRVFKMKLDYLIKDLRSNKIFGTVKSIISTIEFQKRGLPHAHILLFLAATDKYPTGSDIDKIISAEIPDKHIDPKYYTAVQEFMVHGPCGLAAKSSPCMSAGRCTKHFPKRFVESTTVDDDGYPIYRRRDNGRIVEKNGVPLDNRFIVPHNRYLLLKYGAHFNVEWCNQSRSIKYLFKYVNKGHDRVTASFYGSTTDDEVAKKADEVQMYYDCRYISSCEASWRLFKYDIQFRDPPVERLGFHLPNQQSVIFSDYDQIDDVVDRLSVKQSMFLAWMKANKEYPEAKELTYSQFPTKFIWDKYNREWRPRQKRFSIGRIFYVPPGSGELYYLRCLLNVVRGPISYEDIRYINGEQHSSYRDACYALGLLDDDKEYIDGIIEASHWASASSLRKLFATLLTSESLIRPEVVWNHCWIYMTDDILYRQRLLLQHEELHLEDDEIKNYGLVEVEKLLRNCGRSLREFEPIPFPPSEFFSTVGNSLIREEMCYDRSNLSQELNKNLYVMTSEQRHVYDEIMEATRSNKGGLFFVYGYGGTGKAFIWRTLSAAIRCKGDIVLNVASSGIASLLLPGGRTAHSRFKIPINPTEDSTCNIKQGSPLADLIIRCKLIIWDEAPMMHRYCFEALDKTMRDILRINDQFNIDKPFGGKTVVLGGDFRQILPVIPKGTRQDIVHATINSSYLWRDCKVLRLTKNMRLRNLTSVDECAKLKQFSDWIASVGDGTIGGPNDGHATIEFPSDLLIKYSNDPTAAIVKSTYSEFTSNITDDTYFEGRSILAPTLDIVESVNEYMLSINSAEEKTYLSSDTTCRSDSNNDLLQDLHTPEFLNSLKCSGVPNHVLHLKIGTPVMLLRNIDHSIGLCNGTRMVITRLGAHVLEAKILGGNNSGERVLLPRMSLTPSDPRLPFKFNRRQFPLIVSYAMTINKSQGQSLHNVGIFLKKPVFSHGQLYVAISRVTNRKGLKILICDNDVAESNSTTNVVFKEVFEKI